MPVSLLDVNVLVALFSQDSSHHAAAQHWFSRNAGAGWATCPFTQAGFVRVVSNPAAFPNPSPPEQAIDLLAENMQHPAHVFGPMY